MPDRPARRDRLCRRHDRIRIDPVVPIEIGERAGLPEMLDTQPARAVSKTLRAQWVWLPRTLAYVFIAETKLKQNDPAGAKEVLKKAVQNSPKSAAALVVLGIFHLARNRSAEAEQEFKSRATAGPERFGCSAKPGRVAETPGTEAGCRTDLQTVIGVARENISVHPCKLPVRGRAAGRSRKRSSRRSPSASRRTGRHARSSSRPIGLSVGQQMRRKSLMAHCGKIRRILTLCCSGPRLFWRPGNTTGPRRI